MSLPANANDVIYLKILVFSFIAAFGIKKLPFRNVYCAAVGLMVVMIVCGADTLHSLALALGNLVIILYYPRQHLARLSFVYTFGYLAFFRSCHYLGLPKACPHSNAVQLMMSLRCIGLAFEIQDKEREEQKAKEKDQTKDKENNCHLFRHALQYFQYYFNFIGLFTGPYYTYRVHVDMVESPYIDKVPSWEKIIHNAIVVPPILISILLLVSSFFSVEDAHLESFYEQSSFLYRFFYMVPIFVHLRMRLYIAWTLAEACCAASGLGAYPVETEPKIGCGPNRQKYQQFLQKSQQDGFPWKDVQFSHETIHNLDIYGCEFTPKFRDAMKCWNRSVQFWLSNYIYRRSPRSIRTTWTLVVSAFWHGIHPGYYFSFLTIPLCLLAEDLMFDAFEPSQKNNNNNNVKVGLRVDSNGNQQQPEPLLGSNLSPPPVQQGSFSGVSYPEATVFSKFWWLFRMRALEYINMPFLLLSYGSTLRFITSVGFYVHILLAGFIVTSSTVIQLKLGGTIKEKKAA